MFLLLFSLSLVITQVNTLAGGIFQLQILHNNDVHSKFEPTNVKCGPCSENDIQTGECYGGIARMQTAIRKAQEEANHFKIPTIVLNAGDFFTGTPYYALKKWEIVTSMVNALPFDVTTLGNHEFDDGIDNLVNFINHVKIPVVSCNLDFESEPRLKLPNLKSSHILRVDGVQIGVTGCVTPWTMGFSKTEKLKILEEIPSIRAEVKKLIESGVKIIILLSHTEFEDDIKIAEAIPELSLIVGGHSHTFLHTPPDKVPSIEKALGEYPYMVKHESGKIIPIVQVYAFGKYLGKLSVIFNYNGDVISATGNPMLLGSSVPEDEVTKEFVEKWLTPLRPLVKLPFAYTRVPLQPANLKEGEFESSFANLVTDALVDYSIRQAINNGSSVQSSAYIALINTFTVRWELGSRDGISLEDVMDSLHTGNVLGEVTYPGSIIKAALEYSMITEDNNYSFPNFLHVSGLKIIYDLSKPANHRAVSIKALCPSCTPIRFKELKMDQHYKVILPWFLIEGGQNFKMLDTGAVDPLLLNGVQVRDIVEDYLKREKVVYPVWDGRVTVINRDFMTFKTT